MAYIKASARAATGYQSRPVFRRAQMMPRVQLQVDQPLGSIDAAASSTQQQRYAFVMLGGMRQLMQEGHDYTCPRRYLLEARVPSAPAATLAAATSAAATSAAAAAATSSSGNGNGSSMDRFIFHNVLGVRADGVFRWGKPFVPHAAVEVEVLEEFLGPVPLQCSVDMAEDDLTMARYRVKHIDATLQGSHHTLRHSSH